MAGKDRILVLGSTGSIGRHIIWASLKEGNPTFALVKNTTSVKRVSLVTAANPESKEELLERYRNSGVTLLDGDMYDYQSLVNAIKQVDVVICAAGRLLIEDQMKIISAIKEAGQHIKRFFPSEFGLDVDRHDAVVPVRDVFEEKAKIRRIIEAEGIPYTYLVCHAFTGYFLRNLAQLDDVTVPPRGPTPSSKPPSPAPMAFSEFRALDEKTLIEYIKSVPALTSKLGNNLDNLSIKEVGDGNLNFVYIVANSAGSFVIKQALPYVRSQGESWPMTIERAYFESEALKEEGRYSPEHVPEVYHFDRTMCLIGIRYLEPPHIILRKGLVAGIEYPLLADHMADFMANTLFFTSLLFRSTTEHKRDVAKFCGNVELCRLTEQVVFSDPYKVSQYNRWTSPYLDPDAEALREDNLLKLEVAELKSKFCEMAQALIHGDLHTSSMMVTRESTQVIDAEFSFYGPMGYDVGAFLGNLILAFFAQDGHADHANDRKAYKEWILKTIEDTWNLFHHKFTSLWDKHRNGAGEAYLPAIYNNPEVQRLVQKKYMTDLFHDSLGFGAAKMIRRIVGVAHVEDFESIADVSKRATCERHALDFAKMLLKERRKFNGITEIISAIRQV